MERRHCPSLVAKYSTYKLFRRRQCTPCRHQRVHLRLLAQALRRVPGFKKDLPSENGEVISVRLNDQQREAARDA